MNYESRILSVVIATYNRRPELEAMLDSLLPQTKGQPVEVVIADDGSTDDTWQWLHHKFSEDASIVRIRTDKNSGPGPARNAALAVARGRYFVPLDSDFLIPTRAIESILRAIQDEPNYRLLFFPCLQYPGMKRLDKLTGRREIEYRAFVSDDMGELIPVVDLEYMKSRGLTYPNIRAGGESLLWADILSDTAAIFLDAPIVLYRTDVSHRICTIEYQMEHPRDMAEVADALVRVYSRNAALLTRQVRMKKYLAAGTYHLLAGNMGVGRRRLISATTGGCWSALPTLIASFFGRRLFRSLFRLYRTKLRRAYI